MSKRRFQGQQGESNTAYSIQAVEVSGSGALLTNLDYQAWVVENGSAVTLPPNPYVGQEVVVGVGIETPPGAGVAAVAGGANSIVGGDFSLNDGESARLVFSNKKLWIRESSSGSGGILLQEHYTKLTESATTSAGTYEDLLSLGVTVITGAKMGISFTAAAFVSVSEGAVTTDYRLTVTLPDLSTVVLEGAGATGTVNNSAQGAAINEQIATAGPGLYVVTAQWKSFTSSIINPVDNPDENHADLTVRVLAA